MTPTNKQTAARNGRTIGRPRGSGHPYSPAVARRKVAAYCEELRTTANHLREITRTVRARRVPFAGLLQTRAMQLAMQSDELWKAVAALRPEEARDDD